MPQVNFSNPSKFIVPLLVIILVGAAFAIGMLWTKVSFLEKGSSTKGVATEGLGPTGGASQGVPTKASDLKIPPVIDQDHIKGEGKLTWIEYSDLECPYCKQIHPYLQKMVDEYAGKVRWVYRHFPIDSLHPKARKEAEASECVFKLGGEGAFWKFTDRLFEITPANNGLDAKQLPEIASFAGVNRKEFNKCLESGEMKARVDKDLSEGTQAGINGTPGGFLLDDKGNAWVVHGVNSSDPYTGIKGAVERALNYNK